MSVAVMWFRRDLRVRDLPALVAAAGHDAIVPVFVFDDRLITGGRFPSVKRVKFMLGCLHELDEALRDKGARLVIREGRPETVIPALVEETGADAVYFTGDASPWSRRRDQAVVDALGSKARPMPGSFVVDDPSTIRTKQGKPYTVFSPFARTWLAQERRPVLQAPRKLQMPSGVKVGRMPALRSLGFDEDPELTFEPGETAGRKAMTSFLRTRLQGYDEARDHAAGGSSRLSPYLRWGCVSALELDARVEDDGGADADAYRNEIAWRDYYAAVLMHFPHVTREEFQERYRKLEWHEEGETFDRWREGTTGYPFVDAGMRQLLHEGWMHNRVRMVVGSFLTKDLHLDWRLGEAHFMHHLVDGDMAANNGGWQWIASVGTDPKPYFQRLFNPVTQQRKFDPEGEYVRRWIPELANVPDDKLFEPWTMSDEQQEAAGCRIGEDYPEPIIDHAEQRRVAQDRYRAV